MFKQITFMVILGCLVSVPVLAEDAATGTSDVSRMRATLNKELQRLDDDELASIVDAQSQHLNAMKALQEKMKTGGKADFASAIAGEIDRFSREKTVEKKNVSADIAELAQLQGVYMKSAEAMPLSKANKTLALVQSCDKALGALQETLTKKNDVQGALEARTEREALKQIKEVTSSEMIVAAARATDKVPVTIKAAGNDKAKEKQPAVAAAAKQAEQAKKKYSGSPEKRVRQRFDDLCKNILKQDYVKASEYVDPTYVKDQGAEQVKRQLEIVFPFIQFADDPHRKLTVDSVTMDEKEGTGSLIPRLWALNKWHELGATKWTETDGDWYLALDNIPDRREQRKEDKALDKIERQENQAASKRFVPLRKFRKR